MVEEWRDIKGFEGFYQVSNFGRVRSLDCLKPAPMNSKRKTYIKKGTILKTNTDKRGYEIVRLNYHGKHRQTRIHRLVAEAFIDNPNRFPAINHIDENKKNNMVENLEWCSYSYNSRYSNARKIVGINIKTGNVTKYDCILDAVKDGFVGSNISAVCRGKRKQHKGYKWGYEDDE